MQKKILRGMQSSPKTKMFWQHMLLNLGFCALTQPKLHVIKIKTLTVLATKQVKQDKSAATVCKNFHIECMVLYIQE